MTELVRGFSHRLRETVTHWIVGGLVLLVTGFVPEEWLGLAGLCPFWLLAPRLNPLLGAPVYRRVYNGSAVHS